MAVEDERHGSPQEPPGAERDPAVEPGAARSGGSANMLPRRGRRRFGLERLLVRLVATCGIVGIAVALGAILGANKVEGWITGLVIGVLTVILSALLWSSTQL